MTPAWELQDLCLAWSGQGYLGFSNCNMSQGLKVDGTGIEGVRETLKNKKTQSEMPRPACVIKATFKLVFAVSTAV